MANLENLTSKILHDAKVQSEELVQNAENEKAKIISKRVAEANEIATSGLEKAKSEAATRKERIISNAHLQVRNKKLESKGKVISTVFDKAVENLTQLDSEIVLTYFKNAILSMNIEGDESIIVNEKTKNMITNAFVSEINAELSKAGKKGELKLSNETRDIKGGFILEKNGIEVNNTFEALVNSLKEDLEYEVANVLFN